ncbi:unnamed protein product, partial [marine sediment metagenome]
MSFSAYATQPHGPFLPTALVGDQIELMDRTCRARFHQARDTVLVKAEAFDGELYRGGLSLNGSGRVLSLLAGHGGSVAVMEGFNPDDVRELSSAADLLDPSFVVKTLLTLGFDPEKDPLDAYYWSAIEFVRACS